MHYYRLSSIILKAVHFQQTGQLAHLSMFLNSDLSTMSLQVYLKYSVQGLVISTSHLLSEFQVSEHITCMDSKLCEQIKNPKHITAMPSLMFTHPHHKQVLWHL